MRDMLYLGGITKPPLCIEPPGPDDLGQVLREKDVNSTNFWRADPAVGALAALMAQHHASKIIQNVEGVVKTLVDRLLSPVYSNGDVTNVERLLWLVLLSVSYPARGSTAHSNAKNCSPGSLE